MLNKKGLMILIVALCVMPSVFAQPRNNQRRSPNPQFETNELTGNKEQEVLDYISKTYPNKYENLMKLKSRRPQLYKQTLFRAYKEMEFSRRLKEENPEQYENLKLERELESQSQDLAIQYNDAETDEERKAIEEKLESVLIQAFEVKQANREYEIQKLEDRLNDLIEKNEERKSNKSKIIQKRLNQLLGVDELKW